MVWNQKLSDVLSRTEYLLSRATGELDPAALAFNSAKEVYASAAEYRGNLRFREGGSRKVRMNTISR